MKILSNKKYKEILTKMCIEREMHRFIKHILMDILKDKEKELEALQKKYDKLNEKLAERTMKDVVDKSKKSKSQVVR